MEMSLTYAYNGAKKINVLYFHMSGKYSINETIVSQLLPTLIQKGLIYQKPENYFHLV